MSLTLGVLPSSGVFAQTVLGSRALSPDTRSVNNIPGRIESTAQRLPHQLEKKHYEVARGYFKLYGKEDCDDSYRVWKSCFSNNPAAPYILPVLPTWSDEWLDPNLNGVFGRTYAGYSTTFRVDAREAIVILGQLPPPGRYFGLQTNVFTRQGHLDLGPRYDEIKEQYPAMADMFFAEDPIDGTRIQLLATFGNSINNVVIQDASGAAFNQDRYFITTPDQTMAEVVKGAFSDVGIEDKAVFTEPISSLLRVGTNQAADDFFTVIRYAMPNDAQERHPASKTWRQDLPLVVLRVRDRGTDREPVPYAPVQLGPRPKQDPPETALQKELDTLATGVCQRWGASCELPSPPSIVGTHVWSLVKVQMPPIKMIGPECIPIGMDCLADNSDAALAWSPGLPLDGHRVYAVVGALSTATRNATYVGLGMNDTKRQQGFDNISDRELLGSADDYWAAVPSHSKFFVYYLARDCTTLAPWAAQHCRSIATSDLPDYSHGDPNRLVLSLRDYIFPGSERGPDAEYVLAPYVIAVNDH